MLLENRSQFLSILLIYLISVIGHLTTCSESEASDDWQYWAENTISVELNEKLFFELKPKFQFEDNFSDFYYWESVQGFKYKFNKHLDLGLYHLYARADRNNVKAKEHRGRVDATFKWKMGSFKFSDRNRYEFRTIQGSSKTRYRNKIKISKNVEISEFTFTPYISNEFFIDFKTDEFNQNRGSIGVSKKINDRITTGIYYMIISVKRGSDWDEANIIGTEFKISL